MRIVRKITIVGLAIGAVVAFSAIVAASALAVSEELLNGAVITTATSVEAEGSVTLSDTLATGEPIVDCSGTFEGTVGPGAVGKVNAVLDLEGKVNKLDCEGLKLCSGLVIVEPLNLPWATLIELMEAAPTFLVDITAELGGSIGFKVTECKTILGNMTDECTITLISGSAENSEASVLGHANFAEPILSEKLNCSQGGAESGTVVGDSVLLRLTETLSLS